MIAHTGAGFVSCHLVELGFRLFKFFITHRINNAHCHEKVRTKILYLHLADVRVEYPGKHMAEESSAVMIDGNRVWKTYETLYVDGEDFGQIGADFEKDSKVAKVPLGNGMIRFMRQRELVDYAVKWIGKNRKRSGE